MDSGFFLGPLHGLITKIGICDQPLRTWKKAEIAAHVIERNRIGNWNIFRPNLAGIWNLDFVKSLIQDLDWECINPVLMWIAVLIPDFTWITSTACLQFFDSHSNTTIFFK